MFAKKNSSDEVTIVSLSESTKVSASLSAALHLIVLLFVTFSFNWSNKLPEKEAVYTVEILPISKRSNIQSKTKEKIEEKKEEEKKEEEKKQPPKPKSEPKKELPAKAEENPKAEPKKEEKTTPSPTQKPVIKKEEKKIDNNNNKTDKKEQKSTPQAKKEQPKDDDFDALLKTLEKQAKPKDDSKAVVTTDNSAKGTFQKNLPLSISLEDDIRRQIETCWTPPSGGLDAAKLATLLQISLQKDGTVTNVKVLEKPKINNNRMVSAAVDAAVRAIKKCSPLKNLPEDQYEVWKELEFNFDPSKMIY